MPKFYLGDIRDKAFIDSVFEKEEIDGVIHFRSQFTGSERAW